MDFGICRLALVAVRKEPADESQQITQLLFGDAYEVLVLSADKKWMRIKIAADQCEGWLATHHHHPVTQEYFDQVAGMDFKITMDIASSLLYKKSPLTIVMGSVVPISASELFKIEEQLAFNGESKSLGQKRDGEFVGSVALKYINAPFQPGGKSPFGMDASGLTQMVYKIAGYLLPRELSKQATLGRKIKSVDQVQCGDLAFFSSEKGDIVHAGIALADDKIIHSFGRVRVDYLNEEGILDAETKIYTHHLSFIRRIIGK